MVRLAMIANKANRLSTHTIFQYAILFLESITATDHFSPSQAVTTHEVESPTGNPSEGVPTAKRSTRTGQSRSRTFCV